MRIVIIAICILFTAQVVLGQDSCAYGLRCGAAPWELPQWPSLPTPSPIPTVQITATPTPTNTPHPTSTDSGPPTTPPPPTESVYDVLRDGVYEIGDMFATANGMLAATPLVIMDIDGTPVPSISGMLADGSRIFGLVKGISSDWAGPFSPLVTLSVIGLLVVASVRIMTFILPLIAAVFGIVRKIVVFILEFIPG